MSAGLYRDVVVIGGGPAGMTAALQMKRYDLDPLLIEATCLGGLLWNANLVENYPGFPGGIAGPQLVHQMVRQFELLAVDVCYEEVLALNYEKGRFLLTTQQNEYQSRIVVIASGTKPRQLPAHMLEEGAERYVYYEVYPLRDLIGRKVAILGAGDAAFDYALNLAPRNRITIINRSSTLKCLPLLWQRARQIESIAYVPNTNIVKVAFDSSAGLLLSGQRAGEQFEFHADVLLCALGREPRLDFLTDKIQLLKAELLKAGRLYFIGDVHRGIYRQTGIAIGDGLLAAMQIYRTLKETELCA